MTGERFTLDTNILVYFVHAGAGPLHTAAIRIVETAGDRDCCLTLQALSEFFVVTANKRKILPPAEAAAQIRDWLSLFPVHAYGASDLDAALGAVTHARASFWDALMCAAAASAGCRAMLTEDMHDGAIVGGLRIVHPFRDGSLSPQAASLLGLDVEG